MSTIGAIIDRAGLGLHSSADPATAASEVESALLIDAADLAAWPADDLGALRRLLVIMPVASGAPSGPLDAAIQRLSAAEAAGVVLTADRHRGRPTDLPASLRAEAGELPLLVAPESAVRVWARTMAVIRDDRDRAVTHAVDEYREMHREAARGDGLRRLLRWLSRQVTGDVVLLTGSGTAQYAFPGMPRRVLDQAAGAIERVLTGTAQAAGADLDSGVVHVEAIGKPPKLGALVVTGDRRFSMATRRLIGDVARLVELLWRMDEGTGRLLRLDEAEIQVREAVLHLLVTGNLQAARRVAEALGPSLADEIDVHIVECPAEARDVLVRRCEEASAGRAWIIKCPVHIRLVIVLAPAEEDGIEDALRAIVRRRYDIAVGSSHTVPLHDMGHGYEQAFHALATARGSTTRCARFDPRGDLAALLRPNAYAWAQAMIAPLAGHTPSRPHDPDSGELIATLGSWLTFQGRAARQLKIHRNTLSARLRLIERLLGYPLRDMETRSRLYIATRILDGGPRTAGDQAPLDALLTGPEIHRWARAQLSPLLEDEHTTHMTTLRAWLDHDARLKPTATALGMSVPGTRKRLTRIEEILGRSLLTGPSACYDLWFALRVLT